MNCDDVRDQLPDYWTGTIEEGAKARMQSHFASCPACRAEAETLRVRSAIPRAAQ